MVRKGISIEHSGIRSWENNCFVFTPHDIRIFIISIILVFPLLVILILIQLHLAREGPWGNTYLGTTRNSLPSINWRHRTEWTFFPLEALNILPHYHLKFKRQDDQHQFGSLSSGTAPAISVYNLLKWSLSIEFRNSSEIHLIADLYSLSSCVYYFLLHFFQLKDLNLSSSQWNVTLFLLSFHLST